MGGGMPMGGYNATTWDGEFEHLRKKMKERMAGADELILLIKTRKHPILEAEMINLYQILRQKRVEQKGHY